MKLLAVTPTLGRSPWFSDTVASVARLGPRVRHVVVAPSSALPELRQRAGSARVVADPGGGMYAAINAGLRTCASERWDWFTYINDDDVLLDGMARVLDSLTGDSHSGGELIYGRVCLIASDGGSLGEIPVSRQPADLMALFGRGIIPLAQPGTLVARRAVESAGGFDETYRSAGDMDWFVRLLLSGVRARFANRRVAAFRLHAGQASKDEQTVVEEKERIQQRIRAAGAGARGSALFRFRVANLGVYLGRVRRFGFARMEEIYRRP